VLQIPLSILAPATALPSELKTPIL
jgi:hypothetical protein